MAAVDLEASDVSAFGLEQVTSYFGHLTPASQLVTLPKQKFASADETHIRVWGPAGDVAKMAFPSNRRSMVCALTFCPSFSMIITGEIDMSLKVYNANYLELLESFSLEQVRSTSRQEGKAEKSKASGKVTTLACVSGNVVFAGGECGCEVFKLSKSTERRSSSLRGFEFRLTLDLMKQVTAERCHRIIASLPEQRVFVAGLQTLHIFDSQLMHLTSCKWPQVCSACIHNVSSSQSSLLTGAFDGSVNLWVLQAPAGSESTEDQSSTKEHSIRLEHSFQGHVKAVEAVCFYHRLERDVSQRLAISVGLCGKLQVWNLQSFVSVYSLDLGVADSKVRVFAVAPHIFAASYSLVGGADAHQSACVSLMRFTAHIATPFASTNHSTIVQISQAPLRCSHPKESKSLLTSAAVLISEDMAIRVVSKKTGALMSILPPPPNSKVQVLNAFLCTVWQLLILWLSSQEIAIFFVPSGSKLKDEKGSRSAATPLLLRRFSIVDVRTSMLDKDLSREAFNTVSLHYGCPLAAGDSILQSFKVKHPDADSESAADEKPPDWFLLIGTKLGSMQVFRLSDILIGLPIWPRLASHLPEGAWTYRQRTAADRPSVALVAADRRVQKMEEEHAAIMDLSRAPGQRPFPRGAEPVKLYGRWRCHDYSIDVIDSVVDSVLTIDAKRHLKVWEAASVKCIFAFDLDEFTCHIPLLRRTRPRSQESTDASQMSGLALGTAKGSLELILMPTRTTKPEVVSSHSAHSDQVIQVDFLLPFEIFVSVGRDDTVKLWSSTLVLLKEVTFPQPLTCVSFKREVDMNVADGHGDILVGFAAHVEQISFDVWTRSIPKHSRPNSRVSEPTHGGPSPVSDFSTGYASDRIFEEEAGARLFDSMNSRSIGSKTLNQSAQLSQERLGEDIVEKPRHGMFYDFRGPPAVPVGSLCKRAVDMVAMHAAANEPSSKSGFNFEHSQVLDQGDFRAITRSYPTYYDWTVDPSTVVDAPRNHSIRGVAGQGNVAVVTSVGIGHLRSNKQSNKAVAVTQEAEFVACEQVLAKALLEETGGIIPLMEFTTEEVLQTYLDREEASASLRIDPASTAANVAIEKRSATPPRESSKVRRVSVPAVTATLQTPRRLSARGAQSASLKCAAEAITGQGLSREPVKDQIPAGTGHPDVKLRDPPEADVPEVEDEYLPEDLAAAIMDEPWRNQRIARGVRNTLHPPPPSQSIANSDADMAKMLVHRRILVEASEEKLKVHPGIAPKKTDFLYCGSANLVAAKRRAIVDTAARSRCVASWSNGRFITAEMQPPQKALPSNYMPPLPRHMRPREPVTRSEVTEQRLIEAAAHAAYYSQLPWDGIALESQEFGKFHQELLRQREMKDAAAHRKRSGSDCASTCTAASALISHPSLAFRNSNDGFWSAR